MTTEPHPLLIVDDHPVVLFGLRLLFAQHARFSVAAEAGSGSAARAAMERDLPDFAVVDLVMGERDGVMLIEDLLTIHPQARVLVYSSLAEVGAVRAALRAGARGYLPKTEGLDAVADALGRIADGEIVVGADIGARLRDEVVREQRSEATLSTRERQVLQLIGEGHGLQAIARSTALSVKTIGTYRERLKIKLGLDSLRALERYAEDLQLTGRPVIAQTERPGDIKSRAVPAGPTACVRRT